MSGTSLAIPWGAWRTTEASLWGRVKQQTSSMLGRPDGSSAPEADGNDFGTLSYMDSYQRYLALKGDERPKGYLLGVSGEAFKFFYDRANPPRSAWVYLHNPLRACSASLGYNHNIHFFETAEEALAALEQHHESGDPAILQFGDTYPLVYPGFKTWLPTYETSVTRAELAKLWTPAEGFLELGLFGYYMFTLGERDRDPKATEIYHGSFRRADKIARAERQVRGCYIGTQAFDAMVNALRAKRAPERMTYSELTRIAEWNTLAAEMLVENRRAATWFMQSSTAVYETDDEREAIRNAVKYYERVVKAFELTRERHPTTDPTIGAKYVLPSESEVDVRETKKFLTALRNASKVLERAGESEYKATNAVRSVISISEKTRM
ncbi:MAG: hypothetical protein O3A46_07715 [Candidatus Poribacteria bacterium]|nr:hypothetical protein [Candidatus Poribacteria bacterium]